MFGDRNTRYFHGTTVVRRRRKHFSKIQNDNGDWVSDPEELERKVTGFYKKLYAEEEEYVPLCLTDCFPTLTNELFCDLRKHAIEEEIRRAVFSIGGFKAPGKDGFHALFYHNQWSVVGAKLCELVKAVFDNPALVAELNETLITLIPKIDEATLLKHFRPISLCNVSY